MPRSFIALLLAGCLAHHTDEPDAEACEAMDPIAVADARAARLAVRGDTALLGWIDDAGAARVGGPDRAEALLASGARAIDVAATAEGFVAAVATDGSVRVVERVGDEGRTVELAADTSRLRVGAVGDGRLVAFDVGGDSSMVAVGRGDDWRMRSLGRVRGARVAADDSLAAVVATGFGGLIATTFDGTELGEMAAFGGETRTAVAVDVAAGRAWVAAATVDDAGLFRVEAHRWDGAWGEAEAVAVLDGYGDVAVAASPEPRVFVATGALRTFVRREGRWVEETTDDASSAAFPSAASDGSRWAVAWQDADRAEVLVRRDAGPPRAIAATGEPRLPQLVLGEHCDHITWSEWTGAGYRSWYWRAR